MSCSSDVSLAEFAPEARRLLRPDQSLDDAGDFSRRTRTLEFEHIAFGNQPVAEVDPLDVEAVAGAIDKAGSVGMDEIARRGPAGCSLKGEEDGEQKDTEGAEGEASSATKNEEPGIENAH